MPIHLVEQGGRVHYRCLCSGCGFEGRMFSTLEEAREGFFPATAEDAFEHGADTALFFCASCHLRDHGPTADRLQQLIYDHLRRFSPDLALEPGSLIHAVVESILHARELTSEALLDQFTTILRADPGNRRRLTETLDRFLDRTSTSRRMRGLNRVPIQLPKPVPDWCREGALVIHKADGALFRVGTISEYRVLLHGDSEHIQFSRYESFGDLFESVKEDSLWDLINDDWLESWTVPP